MLRARPRATRLTQARQRAKYAIAWERAWPHLARLLTVIGLFLVLSWAGLACNAHRALGKGCRLIALDLRQALCKTCYATHDTNRWGRIAVRSRHRQ